MLNECQQSRSIITALDAAVFFNHGALGITGRDPIGVHCGLGTIQ